jgi:predicted dienelactone hydrolase
LNDDWFDGIKKFITGTIIRQRLNDPNWYSFDEPRIKAVVAEVPFAADFDPQSLAVPRVSLGLVQAGKDVWLVPRFHIGAVRNACAGCTVVADVPNAGHGSFLSPQPVDLSGRVAELLNDPPGFDRAEVPRVHAAIVDFFRQRLLP